MTEWSLPCIGPFSQFNKIHNSMYMSGCLGLYPGALALIQSDVLLQYAQIKWNQNNVLSEVLKQRI